MADRENASRGPDPNGQHTGTALKHFPSLHCYFSSFSLQGLWVRALHTGKSLLLLLLQAYGKRMRRTPRTERFCGETTASWGSGWGGRGEAALGNKDLKLLPEEACSTCIARDKVTSPSPPSLIPRAVLS